MAVTAENTVHEIERGDTEKIMARLAKFDGHLRADLRVFFLSQSGDWRPTKRGINIPAEQIPDLKKAVEKLELVTQKQDAVDK